MRGINNGQLLIYLFLGWILYSNKSVNDQYMLLPLKSKSDKFKERLFYMPYSFNSIVRKGEKKVGLATKIDSKCHQMM